MAPQVSFGNILCPVPFKLPISMGIVKGKLRSGCRKGEVSTGKC